MPRDMIIAMRVNEFERDELRERAEKEHLQVSSYCRCFLFNSGFFVNQTTTPIERISRGIPRRIASQQTTNAVKHTLRQREVMGELNKVFNEGLALIHVTDDMKDQIRENRLIDEYDPSIKLSKLNPPK